jgi:hypothetical protein
MTKMPKSDIATVAQQSPDHSGFVAVINMETSPSTGIFHATNSTPTLLVGEHLGIFTRKKAIVFLPGIVFISLWICFVSVLSVLCHFVKVLQPPSIMALVVAFLASVLVSVHSVRRAMELAPWKVFFAGGAELRRRI